MQKAKIKKKRPGMVNLNKRLSSGCGILDTKVDWKLFSCWAHFVRYISLPTVSIDLLQTRKLALVLFEPGLELSDDK